MVNDLPAYPNNNDKNDYFCEYPPKETSTVFKISKEKGTVEVVQSDVEILMNDQIMAKVGVQTASIKSSNDIFLPLAHSTDQEEVSTHPLFSHFFSNRLVSNNAELYPDLTADLNAADQSADVSANVSTDQSAADLDDDLIDIELSHVPVDRMLLSDCETVDCETVDCETVDLCDDAVDDDVTVEKVSLSEDNEVSSVAASQLSSMDSHFCSQVTQDSIGESEHRWAQYGFANNWQHTLHETAIDTPQENIDR